MNNLAKTIVVGMSGGVDSSVTALLLKRAGHNVIGLFMKNWEEEIEGQCSQAKDYEDVVKVAEHIGIPYYSVSFAKEYKELVFSHFLQELEKGNTPNPDILCNREIKFKLMLDMSRKLGAEYLATGHYAQNLLVDGKYILAKGVDPGKDQSYFIYTLNQEILPYVLFPIGHLMKSEVRKIAREAKLPVAEKKDSTGICFIGKRDFGTFLSQFLAYREGPLLTLDGIKVGTHSGVAYYTIGQRRGLGIGGMKGAKEDAWFVVKKDPEHNIVYVAQGTDHPALYASSLHAKEPSWVTGAPPKTPFSCTAKIRYRQPDTPCHIEKIEDGHLLVHFDQPQRAITVQQSIVFYQGPHCLGGALIDSVGE